MDKEIIIYGKAGCPFTDKALSAFGEKAKYVDRLDDFRHKAANVL